MQTRRLRQKIIELVRDDDSCLTNNRGKVIYAICRRLGLDARKMQDIVFEVVKMLEAEGLVAIHGHSPGFQHVSSITPTEKFWELPEPVACDDPDGMLEDEPVASDQDEGYKMDDIASDSGGKDGWRIADQLRPSKIRSAGILLLVALMRSDMMITARSVSGTIRERYGIATTQFAVQAFSDASKRLEELGLVEREVAGKSTSGLLLHTKPTDEDLEWIGTNIDAELRRAGFEAAVHIAQGDLRELGWHGHSDESDYPVARAEVDLPGVEADPSGATPADNAEPPVEAIEDIAASDLPFIDIGAALLGHGRSLTPNNPDQLAARLNTVLDELRGMPIVRSDTVAVALGSFCRERDYSLMLVRHFLGKPDGLGFIECIQRTPPLWWVKRTGAVTPKAIRKMVAAGNVPYEKARTQSTDSPDFIPRHLRTDHVGRALGYSTAASPVTVRHAQEAPAPVAAQVADGAKPPAEAIRPTPLMMPRSRPAPVEPFEPVSLTATDRPEEPTALLEAEAPPKPGISDIQAKRLARIVQIKAELEAASSRISNLASQNAELTATVSELRQSLAVAETTIERQNQELRTYQSLDLEAIDAALFGEG